MESPERDAEDVKGKGSDEENHENYVEIIANVVARDERHCHGDDSIRGPAEKLIAITEMEANMLLRLLPVE